MLHGLRTALGRFGLLQRRCASCGMPVPSSPGHEAIPAPLCPECAKTLLPRTGGYCPTCGTMFGLESCEPVRCGDCRLSPPPWDRFIFHGRYEGRLRELILSYKFNGGLGQSRLLGELAAKAWLRAGPPLPGLVVPVPLHRRRLLWRGYNQSLELARTTARRAGMPLSTTALVRLRNTPPQSTLPGPKRQANIKDAFAADAALVSSQRVLLVDDVCTTGSTLRECASVLKQAGAVAVDVLVLART